MWKNRVYCEYTQLLVTLAQCVVSVVLSRARLSLAVASILSFFACVTSLLLDQPIKEQLQQDMVQPLQPRFHFCSLTGWFRGTLATQAKVERAEVEGDRTALPTHGKSLSSSAARSTSSSALNILVCSLRNKAQIQCYSCAKCHNCVINEKLLEDELLPLVKLPDLIAWEMKFVN